MDDVEVPAQEISLEDARNIDPDCEIGQFIDVVVTPEDFGRIAAQKARHDHFTEAPRRRKRCDLRRVPPSRQ